MMNQKMMNQTAPLNMCCCWGLNRVGCVSQDTSLTDNRNNLCMLFQNTFND